MKWTSTEARPLITKKGNHWQATEDGSGDFLAALEVHNSEDNSTSWWIRHCRIEDEIGLVVVCDDETEPAGWEIEDIEYFIPIKDPHEESNVSSQEPAVHGIFPIAAQLCTEEQFQKRYYPCRCEKCGWQGCSCYLRVERYYEGDADVYCPNCDSTEIEDTNNDIFFLPNNPYATASKEIGEPLVQNKSNQ